MNQKTQLKQPVYHVLSFDVVVGSLAVGLFAVQILDVKPNPFWWIILPLAVWSVYTLDHLIDGFAKKGRSSIYRHYFHYKYRKIFTPLIIITTTTSVVLCLLYLDRQIIFFGTLLSAFIVVYFVLIYFQEKLKIKYIHKEVFISIVYVAGILLAPLVWYTGLVQFQHFLIFGVLLILVWTESVMVSYYDYEHDKADRLNSFTIVYGLQKTQKILIIFHLILAVILFLSLLVCDNKVMLGAVIIESIMNFILLGIIYFPKTFAEKNYFRWVGETVFVLPAFIVLF